MTDKQIIIDGFNLEYIKELLYNGQRSAITTKIFEEIIEKLERKEQECEELKKEREKKRDHYFMISNENARLEDEKSRLGYALNCKIEKLKQTLTEIKEIAYELSNEEYTDFIEGKQKQILQKLNEVEGEKI